MNTWQTIGWVLIGAAAVVFLVGGYILLAGNTTSRPQAIGLLVGLAVPLGLQVAFGVYMLRRGDDADNPNH